MKFGSESTQILTRESEGSELNESPQALLIQFLILVGEFSEVSSVNRSLQS